MTRIALLVGALIPCWLVPVAVGGASVVPPLIVLGPVLWSAVYGGLRWGLPTAVAAGLLSGPLTPLSIADGTWQLPREWLARAAVFVGAAVIVSMERARSANRRRADALRDPLTGLPTAAVLDVHLHSTLAQARREGEAVALVALDVDDFAGVNEAFGHAVGDAMLCEVALRMDGERRAGDLLSRHSGDEFLLVLARLDAAQAGEQAVAAVHRLLRTLDAPVQAAHTELALQASAGISLFPRDAEDGDALRRHAEAALRTAKAGHRRCAVYDRAAARARPNRTLGARLRRAIERDELELHHQAIWSLEADVIVGVESLVRWRDPSGSLVPPSDFIPVAEHTGVIHALGSWVLAESCDTLRRWQGLGLLPHMGVNLSPVQLDRPGLADDVHAELRRTGVEETRLLLELTESAWTFERPQLDALRAAGVRLAMDDFGTGQSSLGRLVDLPVSVVKIDRSLMTGVPERPTATAVLHAAVQVADAVGCDLVVEGIETDAQRDHLRELGVTLGQGFLMARPLAEPEATALLQERLAPERRAPAITGS